MISKKATTLIFLFFLFKGIGYSQVQNQFIGAWVFEDSLKNFKVSFEFGLNDQMEMYGQFYSVNIGRALLKDIKKETNSLVFRTTLGTDYRIGGHIKTLINGNYQCSLMINNEKHVLTGVRTSTEYNRNPIYAEPNWSPDGKFIASSYEQFGEKFIVLLEKKGGKWKKILKIENAHRLRFSNDGNQLAYVTYLNSEDQLWTINIESKERVHITSSSLGIDLLQWSKDDGTILFSTSNGPHLVSVKSHEKSKLFEGQPSAYYARYSQTNEYVLFTSTEGGRYDINIYSMENNKLRNITNSPSPDFNQEINANGDIVWISWRDGNPEVYTTNLKNLDTPLRLTENNYRDNNPIFSNDGKKIAWVSRKNDPEIFLMNKGGANQMNLSKNPAKDTNPVFSPNDQEVLFLSDRDGQNELFIVNVKTGITEKVAYEK